MKHNRAIALIEEQIRIYDANSRLHDLEAGEKAREAAAVGELRNTVKVLKESEISSRKSEKKVAGEKGRE